MCGTFCSLYNMCVYMCCMYLFITLQCCRIFNDRHYSRYIILLYMVIMSFTIVQMTVVFLYNICRVKCEVTHHVIVTSRVVYTNPDVYVLARPTSCVLYLFIVCMREFSCHNCYKLYHETFFMCTISRLLWFVILNILCMFLAFLDHLSYQHVCI